MTCDLCLKPRKTTRHGTGNQGMDLCSECHAVANNKAARFRRQIFRAWGFDELADGWRSHALCSVYDESWWDYDPGSRREDGAEVRELARRRAKRVCAQCPVRKQCRTEGMTEEHGIWGGLTARERKRGIKVKTRWFGRPEDKDRARELETGFLIQVHEENLVGQGEVAV